MYKYLSLCLLCLGMLLVACTDTSTSPTLEKDLPTSTPPPETATPSPSPTIIPSPTPTPLPRVLNVCLGSEPDSLYPYDATSYAARLVLEAIYDGPIDTVDYTYQPIILEKIPTFADEDAVLEVVHAKAGDRVIDSAGKVVTLKEGVRIRPAGCRADDCAITFDGTSQAMDRLRVMFKLKPEVYWADGEAVTAQDSVYSFNLARDPNTVKGKWLELRTESYVAQDDLSVVWTSVPGYIDPAFATAFWMPLPAHAWDQYSAPELAEHPDIRRAPLGYGAYRIEDWDTGRYIRAVPNPHYFRRSEGLPYFEEVNFRFVPSQDIDKILDALASGECDVLGLDLYLERDIPHLQELEQAGQARLYTHASTIWEHLTFNIDPPPTYDGYAFFADVRARQAVAACIDRQRIVDEVSYGLSNILDSYVAPNHPLYADPLFTHHPYAPDQGRALLDEAGWRDEDGDGVREAHNVAGIPEGTPFSVRYLISTRDLRQEVSARIVADLAACGIEAQVQALGIEELFLSGPEAPLYGRQFDMVEFSWLSEIQPACELYISSEIPAADNQWEGQNFSGYANPEYDALCLQARNALPGEEVYALQHQAAQRRFSEDLPSLPLFVHPRIYAARPDLVGLQGTALMPETWNIEEFTLAP